MVPIAHGGNGAAFKASIIGSYADNLSQEEFRLMEDPDDDNFIWEQNEEPISLYCADESDGESLRACSQIAESLMAYDPHTCETVPGLASSYDVNDAGTEWTFHLRDGVTFHDGSALDANDVVETFVAQWDASSPLHVGRDGNFAYFSALFGGFLNAPASS